MLHSTLVYSDFLVSNETHLWNSVNGFIIVQPHPRSKPTWLKRPVHNFLLSIWSFQKRVRQGMAGSLRIRPTATMVECAISLAAAKASLRGISGPIVSSSDCLCRQDQRPAEKWSGQGWTSRTGNAASNDLVICSHNRLQVQSTEYHRVAYS